MNKPSQLTRANLVIAYQTPGTGGQTEHGPDAWTHTHIQTQREREKEREKDSFSPCPSYLRLTCMRVWWDVYAECSYFPDGAAELPAPSNPQSRRPLLNGALSRASGCNTRISLSCQKSQKIRKVAHMSVSACRPSE